MKKTFNRKEDKKSKSKLGSRSSNGKKIVSLVFSPMSVKGINVVCGLLQHKQ